MRISDWSSDVCSSCLVPSYSPPSPARAGSAGCFYLVSSGDRYADLLGQAERGRKEVVRGRCRRRRSPAPRQNGRADVWTPATIAQPVFRLLLVRKEKRYTRGTNPKLVTHPE